MTTNACQSPIAWDELLAYWLGELDDDNTARIEEHYLGCGQCSQRLDQLVELAQGIGELARTSGVSMVINDGFVERLKNDGLQVREYHVPQNGSVNCTIVPDDDFVVGYLETPLSDVHRIDMLSRFDFEDTPRRQEDVPFIAESGVVVLAPPVDAIKALPASSLQIRLLAIDETGERMLGEYTFNHTPHSE